MALELERAIEEVANLFNGEVSNAQVMPRRSALAR
jgi:hypothetical protein